MQPSRPNSTFPASPRRGRSAAARRRLALLAAGAEMLRTHSLAELSIEALCRQVGATVGAFYSRFESKEAYFNALMALAARDGEQRLSAMKQDERADGCRSRRALPPAGRRHHRLDAQP